MIWRIAFGTHRNPEAPGIPQATGRSVALEVLRTPEEHALRAAKAAGKLAKGQAIGEQYVNCAFTTTDGPAQVQGSREEAMKHAQAETGLPMEFIERIWDAISQYYQGKNTGGEQK